MADLGTLYTTFAADLSPLEKSAKLAGRQFQKFQSGSVAALGKIQASVFNLRTAMVSLAAVAGVAVFTKKLLSAASDLEEVQSKFDVVFKGQEQTAQSWAETLVESYAMSDREAKQYLSSIQDLLVPMGMNSKAAGTLSNKIVQLSADLGSFNNLETVQVMENIQSALTGEYQVMKKYGIVLNATVVQQRALDMGLAQTKDELTAGMKAQASYALMVEGSTAAIGDMSRTMEGAANQQKQFLAHIESTAALLGQALIPYYSAILKLINDWMKINKDIIKQNMPGLIKKTGDAINSLIEVLRFFNNMWLGIKIVGQSAIYAVAASLDVLFEGLRRIFIPLDYLFEGFKKIGAIKINPFDKIETILADFKEVSGGLVSDIAKDIEKVNAAYNKVGTAVSGVAKTVGAGDSIQAGSIVAQKKNVVKPNQKLIDERIALEEQLNARLKELTMDRLDYFDWETAQKLAKIQDQYGKETEAYTTMEQVRLEERKAFFEKDLETVRQFNEQYAMLGKSQVELDMMQIESQAIIWEQAGANKIQIAQLTAEKIKQIEQAENNSRLQIYSQSAGMIADTFRQISEAGGKQSKEAFLVYKAFAIAQAIISAHLAANKALEVGGVAGTINAAVIYGQAMVRVAMIASAQPPSYDQGGISRAKGIYQTGNIDEAHIPLKGGKVPVQMAEKTPAQVTVLNAVSPEMFDQYLASAQGQNAVINVIGGQAQTVRRALG
jgi:hypothetical protein